VSPKCTSHIIQAKNLWYIYISGTNKQQPFAIFPLSGSCLRYVPTSPLYFLNLTLFSLSCYQLRAMMSILCVCVYVCMKECRKRDEKATQRVSIEVFPTQPKIFPSYGFLVGNLSVHVYMIGLLCCIGRNPEFFGSKRRSKCQNSCGYSHLWIKPKEDSWKDGLKNEKRDPILLLKQGVDLFMRQTSPRSSRIPPPSLFLFFLSKRNPK